MEILDYLIKKAKRSSILERIVFVLIFILMFTMLYNKREGFSNNRKNFIRKSGNEIYDDFYVDIYDQLLFNKKKNDFEINRTFENKSSSNSIILDIGCGTGHHVNSIKEHCKNVVGLDISPSMIKKSRENYPECKFKLGNCLKSIEFDSNSFTHITSFYFTIYYIKDKQQFFENCFNWLKPGGILVLHLVDVTKFDPIIPVANPFVIISPQNYADERITKSEVKFDKLNYKSNFELDKNADIHTKLDSPNAIFKETIKIKDTNTVRVNEHELYMSSQKHILNIARNCGFSLLSIEKMMSIQYEYNYLYTLSKPK